MKRFIQRYLSPALLGAALMAPIALPTVLAAQDHRVYHDKHHKRDHEWNDHEDKAYRMWVKENRRKYKDFAKLKESDRQRYWDWRHDHSDALLRIDIH